MGPGEKYKWVALFLRVLLFRDLHFANIFSPDQSLTFIQDMISVAGLAGAVYENVLLTDLSQAKDEALQVKDEMFPLSLFAELLLDFLQVEFTSM